MNKEYMERVRQELIDRYGLWTAHCIHLGNKVYTFAEPQVPQLDSRLRRFLQVVADLSARPLNELRVLDLACLEGHFGIEFALHGSEVLAIEGREANIAKARFAKDVLAVDNIEFFSRRCQELERSATWLL
jgi:2-polyprenyl-3-methyl-5-hydroxy-6-metoxy-1,4-benzoquinol methylase